MTGKDIENLKLHDATLFSLECRDGCAKFGFVRDDKETVLIVIGGVSALVAAPFLAGNIVFDVSLTAIDTLPLILSRAGEATKVAFTEYFGSDHKIGSVGSSVLFISSSYGAEALCVFSGSIETSVLNSSDS